jgi:hypothetical protein
MSSVNRKESGSLGGAVTMHELKGDVTPLQDVPFLAPIQIVAQQDVFRERADTGSFIAEPITLGFFEGTYDGYRPYGSNKEPGKYVTMLGFDRKKGEFLPIRGLVEPNPSPVKVLTGTYRDTIEKARIEDARKDVRKHLVLCNTVVSGADPEIFAVDEKGEMIPAFNFLEQKMAKTRRPQIFWDGFQAEFTVDPQGCHQSLTSGVRVQLNAMLLKLREKFPNARLSIRNVFEVTPAMLAACTEEQAALGCSPSQNIYGLRGIQVADGHQLFVRFAGGHKHFEIYGMYGEKRIRKTEQQVFDIVNCLDCVDGLPSVSLAASIDHPIRRKYYGLAGEHRLPSHGIEYRTPSNFALCHPAIHHLSWNLARTGVWLGLKKLRSIFDIRDEELISAINDTDVKLARKLIERNKSVYTALYNKIYANTGYADLAYRTLMNGVESIIKDPDNLEYNWSIGEKNINWYDGYPNAKAGGYINVTQWSGACKSSMNGQVTI